MCCRSRSDVMVDANEKRSSKRHATMVLTVEEEEGEEEEELEADDDDDEEDTSNFSRSMICSTRRALSFADGVFSTAGGGGSEVEAKVIGGVEAQVDEDDADGVVFVEYGGGSTMVAVIGVLGIAMASAAERTNCLSQAGQSWQNIEYLEMVE